MNTPHTNASIDPLDGKYYGTVLRIQWQGHQYHVTLWGGSWPPSERELDGYDCTPAEYMQNKIVDSGDPDWGMQPVQEVLDICDGHYESQHTYELAQHLVALLNGKAAP